MGDDSVLLSKEELEKHKLNAEIDLLKGQRLAQNHEAGQRLTVRLQSWIPAITVLCTVVTVGFQSCQYLGQQRHLYEVQIDQGLLQLAQGLSDADAKPEKREQAALLLAAYEGDSIPILLTHLRITDAPRAVIESLRLIQSKKRVGPEKVSRQLLDQAEVIFSTYDPRVGTSPYINYVRALSELARPDRLEAASLLVALRRQIAGTQVTEADSALINVEISRACQALVGRECS